MLHPTRLLFFLLVLAAALKGHAQTFSYIYIQGDKKTPFYVKLETEMQPRYGKNYCIIPELVPGPVHLEILFQQNLYPARKFTVLVPEGGYRGFLLVQREGVFSLFDLQQQFYLAPGNTEEDDHLPAVVPPVVAAVTTPLTETGQQPMSDPVPQQGPPPVRKPKPERQMPVAVARPIKKPPVKQQAAAADNGEPQFINGIELNRPGEGTRSEKPVTTGTAPRQNPVSTGFRNSDCPEAMDDASFEGVYKGMMEKDGDENRLEYLYRQMSSCFKTWQARTLGALLTGDATRYSFLKKVYPRITDQDAFPLLDDLLTSEVWKAEFQKLVHP